MDRQAQQDIENLIAKLLDGELSEAEALGLTDLLRTDPLARAAYRDQINMHAMLHWTEGKAFESAAADSGVKLPQAHGLPQAKPLPRAVPLSPDMGMACEIIEEPNPQIPINAVTPSGEAPPVASPVLGFLGGVVDYVNHSRRLMFLFVAVMLSGWFIFQVGSVLLGRWWAGDPQVADRDTAIPGATAGGKKPENGPNGGPDQAALHPNALAWLSGSVGGRWQVVSANPAGQGVDGQGLEKPGPWAVGTEFAAGEQVKLVGGLVEITFHSGAKIVVSAPALLSVKSALATDLHVGKLAARVPHEAIGFRIDTPAGSVIDLGTEFGVEVTPDHKLDVQVFVGEVKINKVAIGGIAPGGDAEIAGPEVHVTAGKTIHFEPGKPALLVDSKENRFQRDLKIDRDSSDQQRTAYLDFVRQLKPAVWLRMEGKETDRVIHDETGNVDGALQWDGPGNPFVKGRVGKGLWFRGPSLGDYVQVPDYPKAEHGKLSVSAWVYADSRPVWPTIAANWRENRAEGQFQFGIFSTAPAAGIDLFVAITPADGQHFYLREGETHPFPLHEWQHVAFTTDGSTLRLYRQGREVAAQKHAGLKYPVPIRSLALGATFDSSDKTPGKMYPAWWDGKIDEIAIFNDVLSAESIQKLAAAPPQ